MCCGLNARAPEMIQAKRRRVKVEDRTLGNSLKEEAQGTIQQRYTKEGKPEGESEE